MQRLMRRAASWATVSKASLALNAGLCFLRPFDISHSLRTAAAVFSLGAEFSFIHLSSFPGPPQFPVLKGSQTPRSSRSTGRCPASTSMPSGGGTPPRLPVIPDKRALHSCPVVGSLWPLGMHEVLPGARHGDNGTNLTEAKIRSVGGVATPCKLEVAVDIGGIAKFPMESLEQDLRNVDFAATYTPFQTKPDAPPVRLIVRRVKPAPGSQLALFATYSYHGFITDRDGETLELEADHRPHAEIENAIRDLKYGVGLNHLPSGRFAANGAWLAVHVMAHNLARWTARIGLGQQIVTTKTLRRQVFALVGRITRLARRLTLHLPRRWPWETQFSRALARLQAIPFPA